LVQTGENEEKMKERKKLKHTRKYSPAMWFGSECVWDALDAEP